MVAHSAILGSAFGAKINEARLFLLCKSWVINYLTHSLSSLRSARSARQHKAWGEASAASETPGPRQINETSPRSGRQPLTRILKCWEQFWHGLSPAPRARLIVPDMILGFRPDESGLHPRPGSPAEHLGWGGSLYATARSAGFVHQVDNLLIVTPKQSRPDRADIIQYHLFGA